MDNAVPLAAVPEISQEELDRREAEFQAEMSAAGPLVSNNPGSGQTQRPFAHAEVNLATLSGGAVEERFQNALHEIVTNIADLNTDPKVMRSITIKVEFRPSPTRANAELSTSVTTKLAPWKTVDSSVMMGVDENDSDNSSIVERQLT